MTNLTPSHPTYPVPYTLKTLPLSCVIPHLLNFKVILPLHHSALKLSLSLSPESIFLYLCSENLISHYD